MSAGDEQDKAGEEEKAFEFHGLALELVGMEEVCHPKFTAKLPKSYRKVTKGGWGQINLHRQNTRSPPCSGLGIWMQREPAEVADTLQSAGFVPVVAANLFAGGLFPFYL